MIVKTLKVECPLKDCSELCPIYDIMEGKGDETLGKQLFYGDVDGNECSTLTRSDISTVRIYKKGDTVSLLGTVEGDNSHCEKLLLEITGSKEKKITEYLLNKIKEPLIEITEEK